MNSLKTRQSSHKANNTYLWLAIRLNKFPLQALGITETKENPIVITEKQRVIYSNTAARAAGVTFGMDETTAQLLSGCELHTRKSDQERLILERISAQLYQFTPYLEIYTCEHMPHSGLLLEISSCLQLFSGVKSLAINVFNYLQSISYSFEYGLAHTAKGAWLLSFNHYDLTGNEAKALFCERLKQLPLQLLHDFPTVVDALEKTGFKTLGDITRQIDTQKISGIKKRLGIKFTEYICEIFETEQDLQQSALFVKPLPQYKPVDFFCENIQFDYPIAQNDQIYYPIECLLKKLSLYLRYRQWECQEIEWTLADIYHNTFLLNVHSDAPESHWQLLYDLTLIQLDNRELPFEVDSLTLTCKNTQPVQNRSQLLSFDHQKSRSAARSFSITMAKLKARLGEAAIYKLSYKDALLPEITNQKIPVTDMSNQYLPEIHKKALRPTWLLATPALIEERQQALYWRGKLTLLAGPERISAHWWEQSVARDYFVAQRHDHIRLWIFFDLYQKTWYVHGIFA